MQNYEVVRKILNWQTNPHAPRLKCPKDDRHHELVPVEKRGRVVLVCTDCDYVQTWVPGEVLGTGNGLCRL